MSDDRATAVGIVGLGSVGGALAARLLASDMKVFGFDPQRERIHLLVQRGGVGVDSPQAVAQLASRVILAMGENFDTDTLLWGENGALSGAKRPSYILDINSGDPDRVSSTASRVDREGIEYLDIMIAGGLDSIRAGKALMMIGGGGAAVTSLADLLQAMGRRHYHVGGPGSSAKARMALALVTGLHRAALAEGLAFAQKLGIDPTAFVELLRNSPAQSSVIDTKAYKMIADDYAPQLKMRAFMKDVQLMLRYSTKIGQALPFTELQSWLISEAIEQGDGELDSTAIIRAIRRQRPSPVL